MSFTPFIISPCPSLHTVIHPSNPRVKGYSLQDVGWFRIRKEQHGSSKLAMGGVGDKCVWCIEGHSITHMTRTTHVKMTTSMSARLLLMLGQVPMGQVKASMEEILNINADVNSKV